MSSQVRLPRAACHPDFPADRSVPDVFLDAEPVQVESVRAIFEDDGPDPEVEYERRRLGGLR